MKKELTVLFLVFISIFSYGKTEMEIKKISPIDSFELNKAFVLFLSSLENKDFPTIKSKSLELVDCAMCFSFSSYPKEDFITPIDTVINLVFEKILQSSIWKAVKIRGYSFSESLIEDYRPRNLPSSYGKNLIIYDVWVITYLPNELAKGQEGQSHSFQFVKINNKFIFFGLTSVP